MEELLVPEGISCTLVGNTFTASKGSESIKRDFALPSLEMGIKGNNIIISTKKGNKNELKKIKSTVAHIKNLFKGLDKKFIYRLEACNVHFPMTLKLDAGFLMINNFLGEKVPRRAKILPGVDVELKAQKITISSNSVEAAGETATNIEKATKIRNRDRRVFQDGIYITQKPGE